MKRSSGEHAPGSRIGHKDRRLSQGQADQLRAELAAAQIAKEVAEKDAASAKELRAELAAAQIAKEVAEKDAASAKAACLEAQKQLKQAGEKSQARIRHLEEQNEDERSARIYWEGLYHHLTASSSSSRCRSLVEGL